MPLSSLSLVFSAFSCRFRPPMTPIFSIYLRSFLCSYSMSLLFIQSIIVAFCIPRVLVPSILPSNTVCRRDSLLNTLPNQFLPRDAVHKRGLCRHAVSVCLSVCLSVTLYGHVKTNKHIFKNFSPSGSPTILVFIAR